MGLLHTKQSSQTCKTRLLSYYVHRSNGVNLGTWHKKEEGTTSRASRAEWLECSVCLKIGFSPWDLPDSPTNHRWCFRALMRSSSYKTKLCLREGENSGGKNAGGAPQLEKPSLWRGLEEEEKKTFLKVAGIVKCFRRKKRLLEHFSRRAKSQCRLARGGSLKYAQGERGLFHNGWCKRLWFGGRWCWRSFETTMMTVQKVQTRLATSPSGNMLTPATTLTYRNRSSGSQFSAKIYFPHPPGKRSRRNHLATVMESLLLKPGRLTVGQNDFLYSIRATIQSRSVSQLSCSGQSTPLLSWNV